ncbi:hypothetical protein EYF80_067970 [Liparis tanakae]|uniref:Uncharacterized protein n=1 Tax=Liparis tanakae TaxID=230148 RepID=A0A4Z2DZQ2_9TELE|nr:hypothetical protein EYF80_067970 [Liparis tanakae]
MATGSIFRQAQRDNQGSCSRSSTVSDNGERRLHRPAPTRSSSQLLRHSGNILQSERFLEIHFSLTPLDETAFPLSHLPRVQIRPGRGGRARCDTRFRPLRELLRFSCGLWGRRTDATVVTWNTSRTLFSETLEVHST